MAALTRVFGAREREQEDYKIGSVKPTIGHSEAASGMAQLTKVILSLKHQMLVPTAVPKDFNPMTPFHEWPFQLQREVSPWKRLTVDGAEVPRRAGITSIGASGVNAHLIVEEYILETETTYQLKETNTQIVFVLSAKNTERLLEYVRQWIVYLQQHQDIDLENVAYTLQIGREEMPCRLAIVAHNQDELVQQLKQWMEEQKGTNGRSFRERTISTDESKPQITATGDLHEFAKAWVAGNTVPWNDLHKGKHRARITGLSTYPFKRRTCWIDCRKADYSRTECAPEEYALPPSRQDRENAEGESHEKD
jgi:acyl transferase domain-containing protein